MSVQPDVVIKGFIGRVYTILSVQLALTVAVCCGCMFVESTRNYLIEHALGCSLGFSLVGFIVLLSLLLDRIRQQFPLNMIVFGIFSVLTGMSLGTVCALYYEAGYGQLIAAAFGCTCGIFILLSAFTIQSRIDFSFLGAGLSVSLTLLIIWGAFSIAFGLRDDFAYALVSAVTFCLYILFDTWKITQKDQYLNDPVLAAIDLYLDLINLFLDLLRILYELSKKNDERK